MKEPTIRAHSTGVGVQSSAITLMYAEGLLPKPDVAIFADTGWEPAKVYQQLGRIEAVLAEIGVPLYRVSKGNLRGLVLDCFAGSGTTGVAAKLIGRRALLIEADEASCEQAAVRLDGRQGSLLDLIEGESA